MVRRWCRDGTAHARSVCTAEGRKGYRRVVAFVATWRAASRSKKAALRLDGGGGIFALDLGGGRGNLRVAKTPPLQEGRTPIESRRGTPRRYKHHRKPLPKNAPSRWIATRAFFESRRDPFNPRRGAPRRDKRTPPARHGAATGPSAPGGAAGPAAAAGAGRAAPGGGGTAARAAPAPTRG